MGHYTSLRAKIRIIPEFHDLYQAVANGDDWAAVAAAFPQHPFVLAWSRLHRCDFIPRGALTNGWRTACGYDLAFVDGVFSFQCSLKAYEREDLIWAELFQHTWEEILDGAVEYDNYDCDEVRFVDFLRRIPGTERLTAF